MYKKNIDAGGSMQFTKSILIYFSFVGFLFCQQYGLNERVPNVDFKVSFSGDTLVDMEIQPIFSNLTFSESLLLTNAGDNTDRLFVVERRGIINVFENNPNVLNSKIFLNIQSQVNSNHSEGGLLGLVFHPDYSQNGKFYVSYTYSNLWSRISEFTVSSDLDSADFLSERPILDLQQPAGNHNGGHIAFGPDGFLYIGFGDGGGGGDQYQNGQNLQTLHGAILRIDVNNAQGSLEYAIPVDNPFVDNLNGWREEIFAYGIRNPWRFSFDPLNGHLWLGDVGQGLWEEVDLIISGANYGWNIMEGTHCYNSSSCDTTGLTLPIAEYSHNLGQSITGGYVYRGSNPDLQRLYGVYLYGDFSTGRIWGLKYENQTVTENKLIAQSGAAIASFGEDENGEVYVVDYGGRIFTFKEKDGSAPINTVPETLSGSGLYTDIENQVVSPGIIEYSVNAPFWSDNAYKRRYFALPDTTKIDFSETGYWGFPPEAVLVKEFYLDFEKDNPGSRKIIETRLLVKHPENEQWSGFTYLWNDQETDALLLDADSTVNYTIIDPSAPGGNYTQDWYFPSQEECLKCHTAAAGWALGPKTSQVNKLHDYNSVEDNQLRSLNHIRFFSTNIGDDYSSFLKLPQPNDTTASIESRARSYLDVNCAGCHLPGGTGRSNMDLRFYTPLEQANIVDIPVELDNMGIPNALRIRSGQPDSSILYLRMLDLAQHRMPPLGSLVVDEAGATIVREWIDTLGVVSGLFSAHGTSVPQEFKLYQNYPNPFNPSTTIRYQLPSNGFVELVIFNTLGQSVRTLVVGTQNAGHYSVGFNASTLSSGVYYYRLKLEDKFIVKKMLLLQ